MGFLCSHKTCQCCFFCFFVFAVEAKLKGQNILKVEVKEVYTLGRDL